MGVENKECYKVYEVYEDYTRRSKVYNLKITRWYN